MLTQCMKHGLLPVRSIIGRFIAAAHGPRKKADIRFAIGAREKLRLFLGDSLPGVQADSSKSR